MAGPKIQTDIVEVYVFRRTGERVGDVVFLQMHRAGGPLPGTWQPVMGHVEEGETAMQAAVRELTEETQLSPQAMWQLESLNTYFLAKQDCAMLSPGFVVQVAADAEPTLDDSHDGHRWVQPDHADRAFLWPGQRNAIAQIMREIVPPDAPAREMLRVDLP